MTRPLLESGEKPEFDRKKLEEENETLRLQLRGLKEELREKETEVKAARQQSAGAVKALEVVRKVFEGQHRALQIVLGELDSAGIASDPTPGDVRAPETVISRNSAKWESWKSRLGGKCAEFIDLLLVHQEMNAKQLKAAAHCAEDTVYQTIYKMHKAGIISKDKGRFSLKEN